ncbi:20603_t:CDS:2, partial [Gigaspora rosea]
WKSTKICSESQTKNLQTYHATKPNNNILYENLIEPEEMKKNLFESILKVGNNEYIENENSGIEFSSKRPRKHEDFDKQRDREYIEQFACNGILKISLDIEIN